MVTLSDTANSKLVFSTALIALVSGLGMLLVPLPSSWQSSSFFFYAPLILVVVEAVLHIGAAVLFLLSLESYKTTVRRAYVEIAIGIVLLAVGILQFPVITATDSWKSAWVTTGGVGLPFLLAGLTVYGGTRTLARLLQVSSLLAKISIVLPGIIVLCVLSSFLPHVTVATPEIGFDFSIGILLWAALLYLSAAWLALQVKHRIGPVYSRATGWLAVALLAGGLVLGYATTYNLLSSESQTIGSLLLNVIGIAVGLLYLLAGYVFTLTGQTTPTSLLYKLLFSKASQSTSEVHTVLDMVLSTAALASNPQDIDPLLDKVRTITARVDQDQTLSPSDEQTLIEVYLELETYLTTKEPLKKFTTAMLRSRLTPALRDRLQT